VKKTLGIRREDKNIWERRVPIAPDHLVKILSAGDLAALVQSFPRRTFPDKAFEWAGATIQEDLSPADVVFAVKEIPTSMLLPDRAYVFFSHTIKGQTYNLPMLRHLLAQRCTLIDYEKITNDQGQRLVFFSRQAGQAGMLETLHALGERLLSEGVATPFADLKPAHEYSDLKAAKSALRRVAEQIQQGAIPHELSPMVFGFTGYGNVSQGAQDVFDVLPATEVKPEDLLAGRIPSPTSRRLVKVVFREEHMVRPKAAGAPFGLKEYYQHPERYEGQFRQYLPHLHVLLNGIYWDVKYPRLMSDEDARELWSGPAPRLRVIGDVSCDIGGSIEATKQSTEPDAPCFVFDPDTRTTRPGVEGRGPVIMAVDNLPAEVPRESSIQFSESLLPFVPAIVRADRHVPFARYAVPPEIRRAVIVYNGELTPDFTYLTQYL
jgi:saccharopine dehydrogenase (NAD+, L-lysine forming)